MTTEHLHVPTLTDAHAGIYWHRELPAVDAELKGEHVLEATSGHVQSSLALRDELWDRCYDELMQNTRVRLQQEIARLGAHYAHVLDESIDGRHDTSGDKGLHGRFTDVLYRCSP